MAQVVVREIDEETFAALKSRAKRHGRSLEAEIRTVLSEAAQHHDTETIWAAIDRFHAKLKQSRRRFADSTTLLRKDRKR
jgi:plasmid stability protein